jgi:hypothetical protein
MSTKNATPATDKKPEIVKGVDISEFYARLMDKIEQGEIEVESEDGNPGKIWLILKAFIHGFSKATIAHYAKETGAFSPVTVYRQASEYEALRKKPATHFQGFEIFEMRVKRIMAAKKFTREEAVEYIYEKDMEVEQKAEKATTAYKASE